MQVDRRFRRGVFGVSMVMVMVVAWSGCGGRGSAVVPSTLPQTSSRAMRATASDSVASDSVAGDVPDGTIDTPNLVSNGGAESNVGAANNTTIVTPSDWTTTGQFSAIQYGASGGFPTSTTPGPTNRGKNFFAGGNAALSTAKQTISLTAYGADIDAGLAGFAFSAWIGGYGDQGDNAAVSVTFKTAAGATLGSAALGPVTPVERKNVTALLYVDKAAAVPKGTREAVVSVTDTRESGTYNDAYVDDINLTLKLPGTTPSPTPTPKPTPTPSANLVLNGGAESNVGATNSTTIVKPSDWTTTGQLTAVQYGTTGFPSSTTAGPTDRGKNFFAGGNVAESTGTQTISLAKFSVGIDSGSDDYAFSAWIGGYEGQADSATVSITFKSATAATLGTAILGPVTPAQRDNATALLYRDDTGPIPKGSRSATIKIDATRKDGSYNDGYVDDVELQVKPK